MNECMHFSIANGCWVKNMCSWNTNELPKISDCWINITKSLKMTLKQLGLLIKKSDFKSIFAPQNMDPCLTDGSLIMLKFKQWQNPWKFSAILFCTLYINKLGAVFVLMSWRRERERKTRIYDPHVYVCVSGIWCLLRFFAYICMSSQCHWKIKYKHIQDVYVRTYVRTYVLYFIFVPLYLSRFLSLQIINTLYC